MLSKILQRRKKGQKEDPAKGGKGSITRESGANNQSDLLKLPEDVLFLVGHQLTLRDIAHLSLASSKLNEVYKKKAFWAAQVDRVHIVPKKLFSDPFFRNNPIDFQLLKKILNKSGAIIRSVFALGVEPWQIAALLGMEKELYAVYGKEIVNLKDNHGLGVPHYYVIAGHEHLLNDAFNRSWPGFKRKVKNNDDYRIVNLAAGAGHQSILTLLSRNFGFDLARFDDKREVTLLHGAVEFGQKSIVEWLIEERQGVDPNIGYCILVVAARHSRWDIYHLLRERGVKPKIKKELNALLIYASRDGMVEVIKQLAEEFTPNFKEVQYHGDDLLTAAVTGGQFEMVVYCCNQGWGTIDHRWKHNQTILHVAAREGKLRLISQLLVAFPEQVNVKAVDDFGRTILFYSAMKGVWQDTIRLRNAYFSVNDLLSPDKNGATVVHAAAENGQLEFLEQLEHDYGRDCLKKPTISNRTALHYAFPSHNFELIPWLMDKQALSLSAVDTEGKTPFHVLAQEAEAEPKFWKDLIILARKYGIEYVTDYPDKAGKTVKDYLTAANQVEILEEINALSNESTVTRYKHPNGK